MGPDPASPGQECPWDKRKSGEKNLLPVPSGPTNVEVQFTLQPVKYKVDLEDTFGQSNRSINAPRER